MNYFHIYLSLIIDKGMKSISEIKEKIQPGDLVNAGKALGISSNNASKALNRIGSKHHVNLVNILSKFIDMRESIINANA